MKKSNKIAIGIFLWSLLLVLIGSLTKLSGGRGKGDYMLIFAMILQVMSIIMLIVNNRRKITSFLN